MLFTLPSLLVCLPATLYPLLFTLDSLPMMFPHLDLLFSSTPLEGPEQMAFDEVLLRQASRPLLRLYHWKTPCVTFGYFQEWKKVQAAFPERMLVRRWSGGGSVEHDGDITFSLIVPASVRVFHPDRNEEAAKLDGVRQAGILTPGCMSPCRPSQQVSLTQDPSGVPASAIDQDKISGLKPIGRMTPTSFYQQLHQALVDTLHAFEIKARLITAEETREGSSCFTAPSLHDIMIQDQKIVGGAQRRCAGSLLHQGSLHLGRSNIEDGRWGNLSLENHAVIAKVLFSSLATRLSPSVNVIVEEQTWLEEASIVASQRYRTMAWMQKR
jgi:lipoate-protein ligase A